MTTHRDPYNPNMAPKKITAPPPAGPIAKLKAAPANSVPTKSGGPKRSSSTYYGHSKTIRDLEQLPLLTDTPAPMREAQFIAKLGQCTAVFDFSDPLSDIRSKDVKLDTLHELVEYVMSYRDVITPAVYPHMIAMVSANLLRDLPPKLNLNGAMDDPDDDEPVLESAWPHLHVVYELFLRFLESPEFNAKAAKKHFSRSFVTSLLQLFDAEDPRERDYLKTTLHRIYGKFLNLRSHIRRQVGYIFTAFTFENQRFNGIAELLEILGSIINGFSVPVKKEHIRYMERVLLPLQRATFVNSFHPQLFYCISQFIEKAPEVTPMVIKYMIRIWPITNASKEVLFLSSLDELLYLIPTEQWDLVKETVVRRFAASARSPHFQVCERSLLLFQNQVWVDFFTKDYESLLRLLYPSLHYLTTQFWNESIKRLAFDVIKVCTRIDRVTFERVADLYAAQTADREAAEAERKRRWAALEKMAAAEPEEDLHPKALVRSKSQLPLDEQALSALMSHMSLDKAAKKSKKSGSRRQRRRSKKDKDTKKRKSKKVDKSSDGSAGDQ